MLSIHTLTEDRYIFTPAATRRNKSGPHAISIGRDGVVSFDFNAKSEGAANRAFARFAKSFTLKPAAREVEERPDGVVLRKLYSGTAPETILRALYNMDYIGEADRDRGLEFWLHRAAPGWEVPRQSIKPQIEVARYGA